MADPIYVGTKQIQARPMNRAAYCLFRGWAVPSDENGADAGYRIEYLDGMNPNVAGYASYISWCPKAQFEGTYTLFVEPPPVTASVSTFKSRMLDESTELSARIAKLTVFLTGTVFKALDEANQQLLIQQLTYMQGYSEVLILRINRS